jgi:tRNA A-37 threonylcarbamoyl transferase component Bud32
MRSIRSAEKKIEEINAQMILDYRENLNTGNTILRQFGEHKRSLSKISNAAKNMFFSILVIH